MKSKLTILFTFLAVFSVSLSTNIFYASLNPTVVYAQDEAGKEEEAAAEADCDAKLNSILSWIACPLIDMGTAMTDEVFSKFVKPMLENVPVSASPNGPNGGTYLAWQQFRILANVILVGTLLVIVYSQAKGGGK